MCINYTLHTEYCTLHTEYCTLHTAYCTLPKTFASFQYIDMNKYLAITNTDVLVNNTTTKIHRHISGFIFMLGIPHIP